MTRDMFYFASPGQIPKRFIALFRNFYGPTICACDAARKNGNADETPLATRGLGERPKQE